MKLLVLHVLICAEQFNISTSKIFVLKWVSKTRVLKMRYQKWEVKMRHQNASFVVSLARNCVAIASWSVIAVTNISRSTDQKTFVFPSGLRRVTRLEDMSSLLGILNQQVKCYCSSYIVRIQYSTPGILIRLNTWYFSVQFFNDKIMWLRGLSGLVFQPWLEKITFDNRTHFWKL